VNISILLNWLHRLTGTSLPAGTVSLVLIALVLPARFPNHCAPLPEKKSNAWSASTAFIKKADLPGAFFILSASILLVAALEEGGGQLAWRSAAIILMFVISGFLWILFILWQWYAGRVTSSTEVMFPRRIAKNRVLSVALV